MKRYRHTPLDSGLMEDSTGQWAKADLAEELYEVVRHLLAFRGCIVPDSVFDMAEQALKKAEEEG